MIVFFVSFSSCLYKTEYVHMYQYKKHDPNCRLSKICHSCLYITTGTTIFNTFLCYFLFNKEIERNSIQNVLFVTLSEIVVFRKKLKFSFVFIDEILFENKNYTVWY